MVSVVAQRCRDVGAFPQSQQGDGGVAGGGQDLRSGPGADAAGVFAEGHIPHVMHPVFDAPVTAPLGEQSRGRGLGARDAREGILDFHLFLAVAPGAACQTADLRRAGPIDLALQACGGLQAARDSAAVFLGLRFRNVQRRFTLLFVRRGKKRPEIRPRCSLAASVGSP